jgi:hypothetical protein
MQEGFARREEREWERVATLGLWVLAPWTKEKNRTPAKLLGRSKFNTMPSRPKSWGEDQQAIEAEKARRLAEALSWARKP